MTPTTTACKATMEWRLGQTVSGTSGAWWRADGEASMEHMVVPSREDDGEEGGGDGGNEGGSNEGENEGGSMKEKIRRRSRG
ncbi:hypothetical protein Scep_006480 [Stephania cephalantha]|uniref:Uncharacterized protein n=1 Tax=Stephania cephalantha TaxID=152367 RepID=A0AAP0K9S4_9MAGN